MAAPPERRFIKLKLLEMLCARALFENDRESCMLYILAYAFLLRFRAEALPLTVSAGKRCERVLEHGWHSALEFTGATMQLRLARRKNRLHGSWMKRSCWCTVSLATCPVHVVGPWAGGLEDGCQPFLHICPSVAMNILRRRLAAFGIERAGE